MLDFPSPIWAACGTIAEKSTPGFAVPDSVHQVKFASPRKLPLRRTVTWADDSATGTSIVSAANSILEGPEEAAAAGADTAGAGFADGEALADSGGVVGGADFAEDAGVVAGAVADGACTGSASYEAGASRATGGEVGWRLPWLSGEGADLADASGVGVEVGAAASFEVALGVALGLVLAVVLGVEAVKLPSTPGNTPWWLMTQ